MGSLLPRKQQFTRAPSSLEPDIGMPVLLPAAKPIPFSLAAGYPALISRRRISTSPLQGKRAASHISQVNNTIGRSMRNANDGPRMYPHAPACALSLVSIKVLYYSGISAAVQPCLLDASNAHDRPESMIASSDLSDAAFGD